MKLKNYIDESTTKAAFFISPHGEIIPADISHIDTVIKNTKEFNITKEYIKSVYNKYKEKVGIEGKAREEILNKLINDGWIRLRRYPNQFWSATIFKLNKRTKDYLYDFAKKIIKGIHGFRELDNYMPMKIIPLSSNNYSDVKMIPINKIANDALYNESEYKSVRNLLVEVKIEDIFKMYN